MVGLFTSWLMPASFGAVSEQYRERESIRTELGGTAMPDIFINFRKSDRALERDRLYRALVAVYGADAIFKSGVSIPAGADYATVLIEQARVCKIMLVLIGSDWLTADEYGYCPSYWDQMEIVTALQAGNTVIPVLVGSAVMLPHPDELPEQIAQLGRLQFQRLAEASFDRDVEGFVERLSKVLPPIAGAAALHGGPAPASSSPQSVAPITAGASGTAQSQSGYGNIQAAKNATVVGRVTGGIGIQNRRYKVFGAEVPATALVIGLLSLGGATAVGIGTAATAGGGGSGGSGGGGALALPQSVEGSAPRYTSEKGQIPEITAISQKFGIVAPVAAYYGTDSGVTTSLGDQDVEAWKWEVYIGKDSGAFERWVASQASPGEYAQVSTTLPGIMYCTVGTTPRSECAWQDGKNAVMVIADQEEVPSADVATILEQVHEGSER